MIKECIHGEPLGMRCDDCEKMISSPLLPPPVGPKEPRTTEDFPGNNGESTPKEQERCPKCEGKTEGDNNYRQCSEPVEDCGWESVPAAPAKGMEEGPFIPGQFIDWIDSEGRICHTPIQHNESPNIIGKKVADAIYLMGRASIPSKGLDAEKLLNFIECYSDYQETLGFTLVNKIKSGEFNVEALTAKKGEGI